MVEIIKENTKSSLELKKKADSANEMIYYYSCIN